jgi:hypothetical protein
MAEPLPERAHPPVPPVDPRESEALAARLSEIGSNLQQALVDLDAAAEQRRAALARLAAERGITLERNAPNPPAGG